MAEAVVSFAVERLGELLISEFQHLQVSDKVRQVQRQLQRIQCFLKEADKKQIHDERVKNWVAEMRDLAFKIEDVIDTFAMKVATNHQKKGLKKMLRRFACLLCECVNRHNISSEIDAIKEEIASLTESLKTCGITQGFEEGQTSNSVKRVFYSHTVEKDFVGREKELEQLISSLRKEDKGCEVVSICGMGGQGKTTLAQKLYNHPQVNVHFKKLAWVCITQEFDRERVLKEVLEQLIDDETRKKEVSTMYDAKLVGELYKVQKENMCLIVLDDIWTFDTWTSIKDAFPVGETTSGSKILLTTRNETVAEIGHVHKIEDLTTEEGWQLLSKKARIYDMISDEIVTSQMEIIGKNIVEKCKCLPLAISSIGGILNGKILREWEMIEKDITFYLGEGEGVIKNDEYYTVRQVLGLSYDNLPPALKHCFLCFANFTEDEVIKTEELYILWMAEGLISVHHKTEGKMLLDVAESIMDELAHRSLVQVTKRRTKKKSWSKYKSCSVHDLIRDLCLSKAKEEKFIKVVQIRPQSEDESTTSSARRLFINPYMESVLKPYDKDMISHVRSVFVVGAKPGFREDLCLWPDKILRLETFMLLRIFTAKYFKFTKQKMEIISDLVFLKCLRLHNCSMEELPSSISKLRYLEILDLKKSKMDMVANVLWKLKHLKYLYLPEYPYLLGEQLGYKGLDNLEVLCNARNCDTYDLIGSRELKVLTGDFNKIDADLHKSFLDFINARELRYSDLCIYSDEDGPSFVSWLECCFINVLNIYGPICRSPKEYDPTRFSSSSLSELLLSGSRMEEDPMILLEKLPNLSKLKLSFDSYLGTEMVCTAQGFPKLQSLTLFSVNNLQQWTVEQGAMSLLSSLDINKCSKLEMLPEGLRYLAALKTLGIRGMPDAFKERINGKDGVEGVDRYKIPHGIRPNVF